MKEGYRHFSRARHIRPKKQKKEKRKRKKRVSRIFRFLSDITYGLLFCLTILCAFDELHGSFLVWRSKRRNCRRMCGDATGNNTHDYIIFFIYIYIFCIYCAPNTLSNDFCCLFFALKLSIRVTSLSNNLDVTVKIYLSNLFVKFYKLSIDFERWLFCVIHGPNYFIMCT